MPRLVQCSDDLGIDFWAPWVQGSLIEHTSSQSPSILLDERCFTTPWCACQFLISGFQAADMDDVCFCHEDMSF